MDRGVWQARVFGVAKCWTQLSTHTHRDTLIVSFCPPGGGAWLPAPGFIVRCPGMGSRVSPPPSVELSSVCIFPASHQLCIPFMSSQLLWNVFGVGNPLPAQIWNQKASIYVYWMWTWRAGDLGLGPMFCPLCSCLQAALMGRGVWEPMCVCVCGLISSGDTVLHGSHFRGGFDSLPSCPICGCISHCRDPASPTQSYCSLSTAQHRNPWELTVWLHTGCSSICLLMDWILSPLPNWYVGVVTPNCDWGDKAFKEVIEVKWGLGQWLSGKEFAHQCWRHWFHPWVGKKPW